MFLKLDFTRYSDKFIFDAVGNAQSYITYIPLEYRRSPKQVMEFFRLSRESRNQMNNEKGENMYNFVESSVIISVLVLCGA